jgi:uncharacterized membrane protein YeaQ/YmgE (transglycosylase-associated protein family)
MITIELDMNALATWIIIGLIAGFLAGLIGRVSLSGFISDYIIGVIRREIEGQPGDSSRFGLLINLFFGLVGALVGGLLFTILKIPVSPDLEGSITIKWIDVIVGLVGAVIVLLVVGVIRRVQKNRRAQSANRAQSK